MSNILGDYDEKNMNFKFKSDNNLPLNKIFKLHNLTIVVRPFFQENKNVLYTSFLRWVFV